jgi:hypothetical protein
MSSDESFIVKKTDDLETILRQQNIDAISEFLDQPAVYIAETVTGALAEGMKGVGLSAGRLVQGALKLQLLKQFAREIKYLREKGRIKEDYAKEKYGFQTWAELLEIIDSESPDEDKLKALKAMFLAVNRINATDGDKIADYQLFQITKKLTSGQLLILKAAHQLFLSGRFNPGIINLKEWFQRIAQKLGYPIVALIEYDDKALTDYRLINPVVGDGTEAMNARLTDLGLRLCQNIATYEVEVKPLS